MAGTTIVSVVLGNASTVQFTAIITALVVFVSVVYYTRFCKRSDSVKGVGKKRSKGEAGRKDTKKGGNKQPNQTERKNRQQAVFAHAWSVGALKGHTSPVLDLDLSPNGKYMASCAEDPPPPDRNQRSDKKDDNPSAFTAGNKKTWRIWNNTKKPQNHTKRPQNHAQNPVFYPNLFQTLRLTEAELYSKLKTRVATFMQLKRYSYPINYCNGQVYIKPPSWQFGLSPPAHLSRFEPITYNDNKMEIKTCCRCKKYFLKKPDGEVVTPEACKYHWGRIIYTGRDNPVYACCYKPKGLSGCCESESHVTAGRTCGNLGGFVETKPSDNIPHDGNYGVYALDCEMFFTTKGLDLAKVTLVRPDGTTAYNELVRPAHRVVDFNTRFSGITQQVYDTATKTPKEVRRELLKLIHAETILVGHSLENDLRALRLVHSNVVDTAIVFPHSKGYPYRMGLKAVVAAVFRRDIQRVTHDSVEDARASLELVLWQVREDISAEKK